MTVLDTTELCLGNALAEVACALGVFPEACTSSPAPVRDVAAAPPAWSTRIISARQYTVAALRRSVV